MLKWPEDEVRRLALRDQGRARILLVPAEAPAPIVSDPMEDWIRIPANEADLQARVDALVLRSGTRTETRPVLDEDGLLRHGDRWVALPLIEARLVGLLMSKSGAVVARDALVRAGWPGATPSRNVLDVHILRLRRKLAPMGLTIRTVRSRGYVLES